MSVRGVTAQELPENQDESVAGVVQNEILHGHVRPAAAMEQGEVPAVGAAVDAFTASQPVGESVAPEDEEPPVEEPLVLGQSEEPVVPVEAGAEGEGGVEAAGQPVVPVEEDENDAAGAGE